MHRIKFFKYKVAGKDILFKFVPGAGSYAVSQCGLVLDSNGLLSTEEGSYGYRMVPVLRDSPKYLHVWVWRTWASPLNRGPCWHTVCKVVHADGDRNNNALSNLRLQGRKGETILPPTIIKESDIILDDPIPVRKPTRRDKLTEDKVRTIRKMYMERTAKQYELAQRYKVNVKTICRIVNRKTWKDVK